MNASGSSGVTGQGSSEVSTPPKPALPSRAASGRPRLEVQPHVAQLGAVAVRDRGDGWVAQVRRAARQVAAEADRSDERLRLIRGHRPRFERSFDALEAGSLEPVRRLV